LIVIKRISPETTLALRLFAYGLCRSRRRRFRARKESQLPDEEWVRRATRWDTAETNATFLAFDGEAACQIVGSYVEEQNPQRAADHLDVGRSFVQARGGGKGTDRSSAGVE
jgi:hypothetical protein